MKRQDYHSTITTNISEGEAFEKIANVSDWWTRSFKGKAQNVGDTFTVQFGETKVAFKIIESVPAKKIVWLVTDCYLHWLNDKTEWKDTKIIWEISIQNKATQISMTHIGLIPGIECYDNCIKGWDEYINGSLLKLLTENKGLPHSIKAL